ncbi:MAG: hypothetical protein KatS3mg113_1098 [Planctomycetaceae bacterium]|nr:MAG: hypothetical protein KatS3mg113_1098 [Planctomycetaceae bacterium]
MIRCWTLLLGMLAACEVLADDAHPTEPDFSPEQLQFYETQVRPLLQKHCWKCHGVDKYKGGLSLTSRQAILKGGESGPAVDLTQPLASLLWQAINYDGYEMPPSGKLPEAQREIFRHWLELGLPMPQAPSAPTAQPGQPQQVDHWAFRPLRRPELPSVKHTAWVKTPIDAFILARLEQAGLTPNPPAPPQQLFRRLHYDLVGLPPDFADVQAFVEHPSEDVYRNWVERLLNSPHHGEHYARYWLDLVRYGESNSFERDNPKPFVWRYRDYVIDYFNQDYGFDQFIREQLAGDEYEPVTRRGIIATGYYRLGVWDDEPADPELAYFDGLDDIISTTGQVFLGLTLNCARCHEHKLDPIPQEDYYRFLAFFRNIRHYGVRSDESVYEASVRSIATPEEAQAFERQKQEWEARLAQLRQQLDEVERRLEPHLKGGEKDDFKHDSQRLEVIKKHVGTLISEEEFREYARRRREWQRLRDQPPRSAAMALCVKEHSADPLPTFVLIRGNPQAKGAEVQPAFPTALAAPPPQIEPPSHRQSTGRRKALAEWIASPHNPLTARVIANRVWQWHFGRGLVNSPNNFGVQGDLPTHPELLDWLACELIEHGWNLKHLHRLLLYSNTYRMSSAPQEVHLRKDPQNVLWWRFDMRRLRAEELRDSLLAMSDSLNLSVMYGPSVYPYIEPEVLAGQSRPGAGWGQSSPADRQRRSIYIHIKRSLAVPLLANFDAPDADFSCPARFASTQPTQALTLLNSVFLQEQAQAFAQWLQRHASADPAERVAWALRRACQREPQPQEISRGLQLLESLQTEHGISTDLAWQHFCLMVLNLNEFVYLD